MDYFKVIPAVGFSLFTLSGTYVYWRISILTNLKIKIMKHNINTIEPSCCCNCDCKKKIITTDSIVEDLINSN